MFKLSLLSRLCALCVAATLLAALATGCHESPAGITPPHQTTGADGSKDAHRITPPHHRDARHGTRRPLRHRHPHHRRATKPVPAAEPTPAAAPTPVPSDGITGPHQ